MSVDVDEQGRVYVAGTDISDTSHSADVLYRLNPDGSLDRTFADGGLFHPPVASSGFSYNIKVLPTGKIMFGTASSGAFNAMCLNPLDGSLDTTYADHGLAHAEFQNDDFEQHEVFAHDILSDGTALFEDMVTLDSTREFNEDAFDPAGNLIEHFLDDAIGTVIRDDELLLSLDDAGTQFFDPTTRQLLQTPTNAAATALQTDPIAAHGDHAEMQTIAPDGSLLVVTHTAGQGAEFLGNTLKLHRLFRNDAPAAEFQVRALTSSQHKGIRFIVRYRDDDGIDASTLGDDDITVTLPTGEHRHAHFLASKSASHSTDATYTITPPDHVQWTNLNNGVYRVRVNRRSVRDIHGNAIAQRQIGQFLVNILV
jgi:hypothetical protein